MNVFDFNKEGMKDTIVLADAGCIFRACFEVWKKLENRIIAEPILSVEGDYKSFKSFAKNAVCEELNLIKGDNTVVFAIDSSSWRYQYYTDYKAGRDKNQKEEVDKVAYRRAIDEVCGELLSHGIGSAKVDKAEADDIIAVMSQTIADKFGNIIIWSVDKDFNQLIDKPNVVRYNSVTKTVFVPKNCDATLVSKFDDNVERKVVDHTVSILSKIISGDKSDNIPSILVTQGKTGKSTGIGEAGSEKIISTLAEKDYINNRDAFIDNLIADACTYKKVERGEYESVVKENIEKNIHLMSLNIKDIDPKVVGDISEVVSAIEFGTYVKHNSNEIEDYDFFKD